MFCSTLYSQLAPSEIAGFDYKVLPSVNTVEIAEYNLALHQAYELGSHNLRLRLSYLGRTFSFFDVDNFRNLEEIEESHQFALNVGYTFRFDEHWALNVNVAPTVSSNFGQSLSSKDFIVNMDSYASRHWVNGKFRSSINFGLAYGTYLGEPQLLPLVYYFLSKENKWMLTLGFPKTKFSKKINERHIVSSFANVSGTFTNISSSLFFDGLGDLTNTKLVYNSFDFGIEYLYRIQPNLTASMRSGYAVAGNLNIIDSDDNELYDFDPNGSIYLSMGLKLNLKYDK